MNLEVSTGPLSRPFACSLAPLTHALALPCLLCSRALLRSLIRSLAHFAHSLARGTVIDLFCVFLSILAHSAQWVFSVDTRQSLHCDIFGGKAAVGIKEAGSLKVREREREALDKRRRKASNENISKWLNSFQSFEWTDICICWIEMLNMTLCQFRIRL